MLIFSIVGTRAVYYRAFIIRSGRTISHNRVHLAYFDDLKTVLILLSDIPLNWKGRSDTFANKCFAYQGAYFIDLNKWEQLSGVQRFCLSMHGPQPHQADLLFYLCWDIRDVDCLRSDFLRCFSRFSLIKPGWVQCPSRTTQMWYVWKRFYHSLYLLEELLEKLATL